MSKKNIEQAAKDVGVSDFSGGNFFEDIANSVVGLTTTYLSGGLATYSGDEKKFVKGPTGRGLDETIGEVTGRNAGRAAQAEARIAVQEEKNAKKVEIANENKRAEQQDIASSQRAYSLRATATSQRNNLLGNSSGRDFLGI